MPKISGLPAVIAAQLTDLVPTVQAGVTVHETWQQLLTLFAANIVIPESQVTNLVSDLAARLIAANNLSDLINAATARTNLGLGTAAVQNVGFFLQTANNLSDVPVPATARTNLGLGSAAVENITFFLQTANNLSDIPVPATARTNLGLGSAATHPASDFLLTANNLSDVPVPATGLSNLGGLAKANNLSDLGSVATARTNLGLGSAALKNTTDFLQVLNNLSDLNNAGTARTNLGLGSAATHPDTFFLQVANNLSDLGNTSTARTNLGLGTAAVKAASSGVSGTVASVTGTFTAGHVATFADTSGTIQDGGASPSGTVTSIATSGLATGGTITTSGTISVTAAVKSDQTTGTSNSVAVTPGVQQFHNCAAKAWLNFKAVSGSVVNNAAYNVSSITDNGTGDFTINFTTAFTSGNYVGIGMCSNDTSWHSMLQNASTAPTASAFRIIIENSSFGAANTNLAMIAFYGVQ